MLPPLMVRMSPAVLLRTAPTGMLSRRMLSVSLPSVSVRAEAMFRAIGLSSLPLTALAARVGVSEIGLTRIDAVAGLASVAPPLSSAAYRKPVSPLQLAVGLK